MSHYTRKDTKGEFLGPDLTLPKMYELYCEKCKMDDFESVKLSTYRKIFNENLNLSVHIPKKDQCNTCSKYYNELENGTVTPEGKQAFSDHQERKKESKRRKQKDKDRAKCDSNFHVVCFDLQYLLHTLCSFVSSMYYMRKLCCYNLSVYSLGDATATCFVWTEIDAKRGASEVATCLIKHFQALPA